MILVTTFGFDEKFQIRAVLNYGKSIEKVIIVTSITDSDKVKKALSSFTTFLDNSSISYEIVKVDPINFINSVALIAYYLPTDKKIIANLSGGMRAIIMETLTALALKGVDADVEIETEDFQGKISFKVSDLTRGDINADHLLILREIWRGNRSIYKLAKATGMSTSAVSRKLSKLLKYGYVRREDTSYILNNKGMIMALMMEMSDENV
ncbi:CRISPR-associated CARF protein Csa3 [Acidianus infernus]|uniref:CRISPR-associated CARF protein Csa3 n=1 Tax=Acidianus infernus TaxID=12915 RepID=UPI003593DF73